MSYFIYERGSLNMNSTQETKSTGIVELQDTAVEPVEEVKTEAISEVKDTAEVPAKKAKPTKKSAAKKSADVKTDVTIEYKYRNTPISEISQKIMEAEGENLDGSLSIYIQPENGLAYYVVNGKDEGKFVTF